MLYLNRVPNACLPFRLLRAPQHIAKEVRHRLDVSMTIHGYIRTGYRKRFMDESMKRWLTIQRIGFPSDCLRCRHAENILHLHFTIPR